MLMFCRPIKRDFVSINKKQSENMYYEFLKLLKNSLTWKISRREMVLIKDNTLHYGKTTETWDNSIIFALCNSLCSRYIYEPEEKVNPTKKNNLH
ncbi:hypothetical protein N665_1055s0005 [Sinapis alba]|nr:hypothetical protein N665_1055s0005 [Sinapis alba]